ncbi:EAL domain protein [mine drainage metagenome]|uniref:EAL domain protein n=1 Tax=mine drainage metagenome TaxID=410659 RepID=A0A1J5SIH5_9ZZZZ
MNDPSTEIFIGRQPIMDRRQQLVAYELLFRRSQHNAADVRDDLAATASVITRAFIDLGIEAALGPYQGFINCDESLLLSDLLEALPSDKIVLEVLETVDITPAVIERCVELKALGFTLALDDFVGYEERFKPLLDIVEIVKVDTMLVDPAELLAVTRKLGNWPVRLLAERVETLELVEHCQQIGYSLFQGYYFAKPALIAGKRLSHSQLSLLHLLGLVLEDADASELEAVFKREPGLAMNLMRLTNSAAAGLHVKVTSLRHAITLLGRRQLQRWLQLLMYTKPRPGTERIANPLMQLAATRGRLMELLAGQLEPGRQEFEDQAFMAGIISLMPALMGVPMAQILNGISLGSAVREALETQSGTLGTMLELTEALEGNDGGICHDLTARLPGLDADRVNACHTQALIWANGLGMSSDAHR